MKLVKRFVLSGAVLLIAQLARADWPNQNPTKWVQRPDEEITGMDVRVTVPTILADDFRWLSVGSFRINRFRRRRLIVFGNVSHYPFTE